jgi:hypothetical protein
VRPLDPPLIMELRVAESSSYPLHPAFNEKSKNQCAQLQCISSTLYSLSQSIAWLQSGELRIAEILQTDGRTDGRTDIKCLSNGRKNLITLKDQTTKMYQSSREICLRKSGVRYA